MGWTFFWPFLDKVFGLGFSTAPEKGWIEGNSPTYGFLSFAVKGPFSEFFRQLAGEPFVDWIFMAGLFGIGLSLLFGVLVKLSGYLGALMLILMYMAGFIPPEHNPFLDEHLIYAVLMLGLTQVSAGRYLGFGKRWEKLKIVKRLPILA